MAYNFRNHKAGGSVSGKQKAAPNFTQTPEGIEFIKNSTLKDFKDGKTNFNEALQTMPRWMRRLHKKMTVQSKFQKN